MKLSSRGPGEAGHDAAGNGADPPSGRSRAMAAAFAEDVLERRPACRGARSGRGGDAYSREMASVPVKPTRSRSSSPSPSTLNRIGEVCCVYVSAMAIALFHSSSRKPEPDCRFTRPSATTSRRENPKSPPEWTDIRDHSDRSAVPGPVSDLPWGDIPGRRTAPRPRCFSPKMQISHDLRTASPPGARETYFPVAGAGIIALRTSGRTLMANDRPGGDWRHSGGGTPPSPARTAQDVAAGLAARRTAGRRHARQGPARAAAGFSSPARSPVGSPGWSSCSSGCSGRRDIPSSCSSAPPRPTPSRYPRMPRAPTPRPSSPAGPARDANGTGRGSTPRRP